jgi:hypothetical protein
VDCQQWTDELVECARRGAGPSPRLGAHLRDCPLCRERWNAEEGLQAPLRKLRVVLARERSPEIRRQQLLEEFARLERPQPLVWFGWAWGAAITALVAVALLQVGRVLPGRYAVLAPASIDAEDFVGAGFVEISEENGFVLVPYTRPLAAGESVRVVRQELNGAELVRMGIDFPGAYGHSFDADVVLGEDGLPRAVHVVGYQEF